MTGRIFDIQHGSLFDGEGVRTAVFFKGCNLNCKWCHNPESHAFEIEKLTYRDKCAHCGKCKTICQNPNECTLCGKCALLCPNDAIEICGRNTTLEEIMSEILKDRTFYSSTGGGVTFTGGECMLQIDFLKELSKACRDEGIHVSVDTAGYVPFESFEKIIPYTNTFLYDVKCVSEDLHMQGTGKSNRLILDNLCALSDRGCEIVVRIPLIVGFNDSWDEIEKIKDFLKNINYKSVEILPYHDMGKHKYETLGLECPHFSAPAKEFLQKTRAFLTK